jgi:phage tail-like protein
MAEYAPSQALQAFRFQVLLFRSPPAPVGGIRGREAHELTSAPDQDMLADGGFAECSGLELEADIKEYLEGGRNDAVIRRVGRVKLQPVVLKRGMFAPPAQDAPDAARDTGAPRRDGVVPAFWSWLQDMVDGTLPVRRFDGKVDVRGPAGTQPRAIWRFARGLPLKVVGPALNARTGELAIEELHIAHEGLWLDSR